MTRWLGTLLLFGGLLAPPAGAVAPGEIDAFSASLEGWTQGGAAPPSALVHAPGGGPAGAGDRYAEITADGSAAGGKIVMFNSSAAWTGNWTAAAAVHVKAKLRNLGGTALQVRLKFEDGTTQSAQYAVSSAVPVAVGSGWIDAEWNVRASALNVPAQAKTAAQILASVARVRVIHDYDPIEEIPEIAGRLGVDDLQILGPLCGDAVCESPETAATCSDCLAPGAAVPALHGLALGALAFTLLSLGVQRVRKHAARSPDRPSI